MRRADVKLQVAKSLFCAFAREGRGLYALAREMPAHVCLSERHRKILFGSEEADMLSISGPRGKRKQIPVMENDCERTLVKLSFSEAMQLGIKGLKLPGESWRSSATCVLYGPEGKVSLDSGVQAHLRHLHISPEHAKLYELTEEDQVWAVIKSDARSLALGNIKVCLGNLRSLELHLDTDEASAAGLIDGQTVAIFKELN